MTSGQSFNRLAVLQVFGTSQGQSTNGSSTLKQVDQTGLEFRSRQQNGDPGYRIAFNVQKVNGAVPVANESTIKLYNLGQKSRNAVMKTGSVAILSAGYGDSPGIIFKGTVQWGKTSKEGPDYVTSVQVVDGGHAFQNATMNQSFGSGTTLAALVESMKSSLAGSGIGVGTIKGIPNEAIGQGIVLSGRTVEKLKEICESKNLRFSIEDEKIHIVPYGSDKGLQAVVVSTETGMIGIPEVQGAGLYSGLINTGASQNLQANTATIAVKMLMHPTLGTLQKVLIQSKFVNGLYTTIKVSHSGDTHGTDWYTHAECT